MNDFSITRKAGWVVVDEKSILKISFLAMEIDKVNQETEIALESKIPGNVIVVKKDRTRPVTDEEFDNFMIHGILPTPPEIAESTVYGEPHYDEVIDPTMCDNCKTEVATHHRFAKDIGYKLEDKHLCCKCYSEQGAPYFGWKPQNCTYVSDK